MAVPATVTTKLARTIAMLSSDQPGERRAAFAAAERLLMSAGLGWRDVAELLSGAGATTEPPAVAVAPDPDEAILIKADGSAEIEAARLAELVIAIRDGVLCDAWSIGFLDSMEGRAAKYPVVFLSVKQVAKLTQLLRRLPR